MGRSNGPPPVAWVRAPCVGDRTNFQLFATALLDAVSELDTLGRCAVVWQQVYLLRFQKTLTVASTRSSTFGSSGFSDHRCWESNHLVQAQLDTIVLFCNLNRVYPFWQEPKDLALRSGLASSDRCCAYSNIQSDSAARMLYLVRTCDNSNHGSADPAWIIYRKRTAERMTQCLHRKPT